MNIGKTVKVVDVPELLPAKRVFDPDRVSSPAPQKQTVPAEKELVPVK